MTSGEPFRAFFGVPLDPPVAAALAEAATGFLDGPEGPRGRWRVVPPERIHITLKFLGDTDPGLLPALGRALREAAAAGEPAEVVFGGWVLLPDSRAPRVLAAGVSDPTGTLSRMAAILEERAADLGFPRERRGFLAHATVARSRSSGGRSPGRRPRGRSGGGTAMIAGGADEPGVTPGASGGSPARIAVQRLGRLVLYRSTLGPGRGSLREGPVYEVVDEAVLAPDG